MPTGLARIWFLLPLLAMLALSPARAQTPAAAGTTHIAAELVPERAAAPGETIEIAIAMSPEPGWHGYWSNPGDAGFGMDLVWDLPSGYETGEPQYPVPQPLLIGPLMNHVYEGPYAVIVPVTLPADARPGSRVPVRLRADWLACTDRICVPETAELRTRIAIARPLETKEADTRFAAWRKAQPSPVLARARYRIEGDVLRFALPLAAGAPLDNPHLFLERDGFVDYASPQEFRRDGNWLYVSTRARASATEGDPVEAVLRTGEDGSGLAYVASPGPVAVSGPVLGGSADPSMAKGLLSAEGAWLVLAAFAGGLLLNIMPCVFPILSLKALTLARAGGDSGAARREALAYAAGVVLAVMALGGLLLALRGAGQQVGWAFQLQEPATLVVLLVLAAAITANFAGLFEFTLPVRLENGGGGAFMTGLLAAFVATPCTGPFMAAAMGAALLLPPESAMLLFVALGLGLAAPFLAIGFVPALRRMLPRPGAWMGIFRRVLAVPMGLTALALAWLCWRIGGAAVLGGAMLALLLVLALCLWAGRRQRRGRSAWLPAMAALFITAVAAGGASLAAHETATPAANRLLPGAEAFSEPALTRARATGKPVFVYFTADWCVTCKLNEQVAIDREVTRKAFEEKGVTVLIGDWTRRDPDITRFLSAHGAAGVPLYLWYAPGAEARQLPQLLDADDLVALARAGRTSKK